MGDALGPSVDSLPVAEVSLREQRSSGWHTPEHSLSKPELAWVQCAIEHLKAARLDRLLEFGELFGFGNDAQVAALRVCGRGAERTAAEQPGSDDWNQYSNLLTVKLG